MLTGINFSPPLYFLCNFCVQLIFPTSIEQLRIQSLVFIIIGIVLSFMFTRKLFGSTSAFIGTILVGSQSSLLLSQAQEARHYAMFFACGAWVIYMQSFNDITLKRYRWVTFLAHFCLCQIHYLGIIFSSLVGLSLIISRREKPIYKRIPFSIYSGWILILPIYLFLLSQQSSHLGNWPKPNKLSDLLANYNDSLQTLTILVTLFIITITEKLKAKTETISIESISNLKPIIVTAFLWISVPIICWILSHLTLLNLFVDRYFIPKESAIIFLLAYGFNLMFQKLPKHKSLSLSIFGTFALTLVVILISTKRAAFGLNKDTNYHHSLIIEESYPESEQPIILESDPKYFPNAYLFENKYRFKLPDDNTRSIYQRFSNKITLVD